MVATMKEDEGVRPSTGGDRGEHSRVPHPTLNIRLDQGYSQENRELALEGREGLMSSLFERRECRQQCDYVAHHFRKKIRKELPEQSRIL